MDGGIHDFLAHSKKFHGTLVEKHWSSGRLLSVAHSEKIKNYVQMKKIDVPLKF
jgi:hypothetical protein